MKKSYDVLVYVAIIFGIMTSNIGPICALETIPLNHVHDFHEDLEFIRKTLFENHPGICNVLEILWQKGN